MSETVLHTKALTKTYGEGAAQVCALREATVEFSKGEFAAIIGASGSGKSTLMHLLGGIDSPTSGTVYFGDEDIYRLNDVRLSALRRQKIGFVFQFYNLIPELTARQNIVLPVMLDKKRVDDTRIGEICDALGIGDRLSHLPSQMSGGQQQRVAIARALSNDPDILLCDEPTGNLDEKAGIEVLDRLKQAREQFGKTVIVVTHDTAIAAQADRVIRLVDGMIQ